MAKEIERKFLLEKGTSITINIDVDGKKSFMKMMIFIIKYHHGNKIWNLLFRK
jgi:hypothetical protein